ncbi:hypothetical protein GGS23DRAFT_193437 [Durotheca rogersii]|uniref:uncharacterized protein n=1 Tax=Durotheca rogersii TaxID=419775 RepID=UPI00221F05CD|nr:uncharacterized protein GGS23DRAFT_193437 [Durotheca rogersii]KAI5867754.1 hypothetical protein GGS23DRAFT_193437 [Durotheca rogersii]
MMQGDIFQMEQSANAAPPPQPDFVAQDSQAAPQVAIYNEDDLSHLLYANHLHHHGRHHKVVINQGYQAGHNSLGLPLSGTHTPLSETNETPVLSDCESDTDEGSYFPVFLGRQAEELSHEKPTATTARATAAAAVSSASDRAPAAPAVEHHMEDISGPMMTWWPGPLELMEHEWVVEGERKAPRTTCQTATTTTTTTTTTQSAAAAASHPQHHVSDISGSLMSWWPAPMEMMEHRWDERFYE